MANDDATLIIGLKDEVTKGVTSVISTLDRLNVAAGGSDKTMTKLATDFGNAATKAGLFDTSLKNQASSLAANGKQLGNYSNSIMSADTKQKILQRTIAASTSEMTNAQKAAAGYQSTINRIGSVRTNSAGQAINAKGQFLSAASVNEYGKAVAGLNAIESQRVRNLTAGNKAQSDSASGYMRAASAMSTVETATNGVNKGLSSVARTTAQATSAFGNFPPPAARYAMYDASNSLAILGAALLAVAVLPAKVSIDFDREFANVSRTVQGAGNDVKKALIDLSTSVPVSFKDITDIATLGGQLGEGKNQIVDFTTVVAKLTATTNLSADAAGTALGRFQAFFGISSDQFANLASSILKVGVNSVATETQIVNISTQIASMGKYAGFTVPQVVGLAGALASIGKAPEASRSTFTRLFTSMGEAASSGGAQLKEFAKIAGVSSDEFASAFGTSKFQPIFSKFIAGLSNTSRNGGDANKALTALGITSVRDRPLLLQLSQANDVLVKSMANAISGYQSAAVLNAQYAKIAQTTSAKIQTLGNSLTAFFNSVGTSSTGPVNAIVSGLQDIIRTFTDLTSTPVGFWATAVVIGLAAVAGTVALVGAAALRGTAGVVGMAQALSYMNSAGLTSGGILAGLSTELAATGVAGRAAAFGINAFGLAMKGLLIAGIVIAVSQGIGAFQRMNDVTTKTKLNVDALNRGGKDGAQALDKYFKTIDDGTIRTIIPAGNALSSIAQKVTGMNGAFTQSGSFLKGIDDVLGGLPGHYSGLDQARESVDAVDKALANMVNSGNAKGAAELVKYMDQQIAHSGVSAKDFNAQLPQYVAALAKMKEATNAAANANKALYGSVIPLVDNVKLITDLTGIEAKEQDKFTTAYAKSVGPLTDFNSVVGQVQKKLQDAATAQADATKASDKASDFYNGSAVSLTQFTTQLQTNNKAQEDWAANLIAISAKYGPDAATPFIEAGYTAVNSSILKQLLDATPKQAQAYIDAQAKAAQLAGQSMAQALLLSGNIVASSGLPIGTKTAQAIAKGLSLGLPISQIMADMNLKFAANPARPAVDDTEAKNKLDALANYKPTITLPLDADDTPARTKTQEFTDWASLQKPSDIPLKVNDAPGRGTVGTFIDWASTRKPGDIPLKANDTSARITTNGFVTYAGGKTVTLPLEAEQGPARGAVSNFLSWAENRSATITLNTRVVGPGTNGAGGLSSRVFSSGGWTGPGSKYQAAGIVHADEFVFPKEAVKRIGVQNLYAQMSGQGHSVPAPRPRAGYDRGGLVVPNSSGIDAQTLHAIMAIANRPIYLYSSDKLIAEAASRGNTQLAYGGAN